MTPYTLILLPGLDGTGSLFSALVQRLPLEFGIKVMTFSTERSMTYEDLLPKVLPMVPRDGPFLVVAESFSTPLAVKFAATHPPNLAGVVLGAGFVTSPVKYRALARMLARRFLFRLPLPALILEHFLIGRNAPQDLMDAVRQAIQQVNPEVLAQRVLAVLDCDARQDLLQVDVPILYVRAERDRLVPRACFNEIECISPGVVAISIDAPHLVFQREPRQAAAAIVRFAEGLAAESGAGTGGSEMA
jgi:pimeloyl-ACP methyl ester carboxylesterase